MRSLRPSRISDVGIAFAFIAANWASVRVYSGKLGEHSRYFLPNGLAKWANWQGPAGAGATSAEASQPGLMDARHRPACEVLSDPDTVDRRVAVSEVEHGDPIAVAAVFDAVQPDRPSSREMQRLRQLARDAIGIPNAAAFDHDDERLSRRVGSAALVALFGDRREREVADVGRRASRRHDHDVFSQPRLVSLRIANEPVAAGRVTAERQGSAVRGVDRHAEQPIGERLAGTHAAEPAEGLTGADMLDLWEDDQFGPRRTVRPATQTRRLADRGRSA